MTGKNKKTYLKGIMNMAKKRMTIKEILEAEGRSTEPTRVIHSESTGGTIEVYGEVNIDTLTRCLYKLPAKKVN